MKTKAAIKTTHRLASFIVIFILVSGSASCIAQLTARGLGMGGAYTALARGIHAPEWNPANLGLPDNPRFSMSFIAFGAAVNNNSFTLGDYNHYFGEVWSDSEDDYIGQDWSERDKEDILNRIPDNGFRTNIRSTARLLSFSTGQFAFTFGADIGS